MVRIFIRYAVAIGAAVFFGHLFYIAGDPRLADYTLSFHEMTSFEKYLYAGFVVLLLVGVIQAIIDKSFR